MRILKSLLYILLLPHYLLYKLASKEVKYLIDSDIQEMNRRLSINKSLFYYLAYHVPYRIYTITE